jgi:hypothetical protein
MCYRLPTLLFLWALALPLAQAQTLYKIVTPNGRVLYTDHPPTEGKLLKTLTPDAAPATALPPSAAEQLRNLQSLRAAAAAPPSSGVVLY